MTKQFSRVLVLNLALLLGACTSVPFDYPRVESHAPPPSPDTLVGEALEEWREEHGDLSGFITLFGGIEALGARLRMMEVAEKSIDAKYFLIKPDEAGSLFLGKLLRAAERGVQVRLLIDDIFTPRMDSVLAILNKHPNVQVRLFNPLSRNSPQFWNLLWDFKRTNRRMHNKAFIVDGGLAIVGGRNIAGEYFELKDQHDFGDFELLILGDIVPEISDSFDIFWNSDLAVPMEAFGVPAKEYKVDRWLGIMDDIVSGERQSAYSEAINSQLLKDIREDRVLPLEAHASLFYDPPDKLLTSRRSDEHRVLVQELERRFAEAKSEIIIVSPYFVPREEGMAWMQSILDQGTRVILLTNSLASTNHVAVHSGYARYRKRLLEAGVEIYELRFNPPIEGRRVDAERVTLHSKAVVIDRSALFAGSLNFDPRSIAINTEVGLFVDSPELAGEIVDRIKGALPTFTYQPKLDNGKLRWHFIDRDGNPAISSTEPSTSVGKRMKVRFYSLLPIEGQL
jgi:putative cardiolipin synthase